MMRWFWCCCWVLFFFGVVVGFLISFFVLSCFVLPRNESGTSLSTMQQRQQLQQSLRQQALVPPRYHWIMQLGFFRWLHPTVFFHRLCTCSRFLLFPGILNRLRAGILCSCFFVQMRNAFFCAEQRK